MSSRVDLQELLTMVNARGKDADLYDPAIEARVVLERITHFDSTGELDELGNELVIDRRVNVESFCLSG